MDTFGQVIAGVSIVFIVALFGVLVYAIIREEREKRRRWRVKFSLPPDNNLLSS
jgi:K+-transporting ATPase KdpF subunit